MMRIDFAEPRRLSVVVCGLSLLFPASRGVAADPASPPPGAKAEADVPAVNLFDAARKGDITVSAEGSGDGRMTLSLTNRTKKPLRVVLPPGLIASGVTGQFGGMGGGMGGMGGGMGGMGGGMGGMGGGMGGMGGGMGGGGMGGGMGGGGMGGGGMGGGGMGGQGGGTMPAMMGMMMLGQLIMNLVGDRDSWDTRSLMSGMMGGMGGGMGGGGMGGGMGGGGMGGGFRSVPPTDLPSAQLKPGQTRHLPTRLVGLSNPDPAHPLATPEKGEKLRISEIGRVNDDPMVQAALKKLATDKAPNAVAQLVMWKLAAGLSWDEVADLSKEWSNAHELTMAKEFIARLKSNPEGDSGRLLYQVKASDAPSEAAALALEGVLKGQVVLGLKAESGVAAKPEGPSVACKIQVSGTAEKLEAQVQVAISNGSGADWTPVGKFTLPVTKKAGKVQAAEFADALAENVLGRLVRAQMKKGPVVKGKPTYKITIENASPLVLNGLAILGEGTPTDAKGATAAERAPKVLSGISISPRRSMTVPATGEMVDQLGLRKGVRVIAADLSGL